jgi:hypothetical protein
MSSHLVSMAVLAVSLGSVVLGLVVGYQAYRGFRRNDSRSMRLLSAGLILLTAVPFPLTFLTTLLIRLDASLAGFRQPAFLLAQTLQFAGLAFITYSLYQR